MHIVLIISEQTQYVVVSKKSDIYITEFAPNLQKNSETLLVNRVSLI